MGNNRSAFGFEDLSNVTVDTDIDIRNFDDELNGLFRFKILLLGTGESGKSTILKQLKLLHKKKLSAREVKACGDGIHQSIISCMQQLCNARRNFGVYELDEDGKQTERDVNDWEDDSGHGTRIAPEFGARIKRLFESEAIQKTYARRSEFWILDGCAWYLANVERVCHEDWTPSEDDCLMARVRTTGIIVTDLEEKTDNAANAVEHKVAPGAAAPAGANADQSIELTTKGAAGNAQAQSLGPERIIWQIVDVGGQRNERKKWIHCFDDVKAILFVDNLAGYNSVLFEDQTKNRMIESLELFNKVSYLPQFRDTPLFLFLNKKDLFEQMVKETPMNVTFPEYKGGRDSASAIAFVENEFQKQAPVKKAVHSEAISARYSREVRMAFEAVKNQVYGNNKEKLLEQWNDLHARRAARVQLINLSKQTGCAGCLAAPPPAPVAVRA